MALFSLNDEISVELPSTRELPTHTCATMAELLSHVDQIATFGIEKRDYFFQDPENRFTRVLQDKFDLPHIKISKRYNWNKRNVKFRELLEFYFCRILESYGSNIEAIFTELKETSIQIGHLNADGSDFVEGGIRIKLAGDLEKRLESNFKMRDLPQHIHDHFRFPSLWYRNDPSFFLLSERYRFDSKSSMKRTFRNDKKNFGSLLLTLDFSQNQQSHPLLDSFHEEISKLVKLSNHVRLNETLYIIPKYPTYTTNHHQDIHVEPHIVIYQHVQSSSFFYFLPILFGLFAQHVSEKENGIAMLQSFYDLCDANGIGSFGEMTPGDLLIVNPCVSHLVQVPKKNGEALTLVRAAELFLELDDD